MLELADSGQGRRCVERYAIARLPRDALIDGRIVKPDLVEAALRKAWLAMQTKTRRVALSLPPAAVVTKTILLPQGARELDIESQVVAEAAQMTSLPLAELSLDWQILGPAARSPGENEVLVVVSRREQLEERVALAEAVGLETLIVDVDSFATLNAFELLAEQLPDGGRNQIVAIFDMGASCTRLSVVHEEQLVYRREHPLGGDDLTQEIAQRYGLSFDEAEEAKRNALLPDDDESEVLQHFLDRVVLEMARALQLFYGTTDYTSVDHIMLAGGCAALPGLVNTVQRRLQTSTRIANPFVKMTLSNQVRARQLAIDAPALTIACGLALRRFDPS